MRVFIWSLVLSVPVWSLLGAAVLRPVAAQQPVVPPRPPLPAKPDPKPEPPKPDPEPPAVGRPDDVPVVPPRKVEPEPARPDPKPDAPRAEPVGDQAVLPVGMVKNTVQALKVGDSSYVAFDAVKVDVKRRCWLVPTAITGPQGKARPVQVRRSADGYHVYLENQDHQWDAEDCDGLASRWVPVRSVTVKEQ